MTGLRRGLTPKARRGNAVAMAARWLVGLLVVGAGGCRDERSVTLPATGREAPPSSARAEPETESLSLESASSPGDGLIRFRVTDEATGEPIPCRLTIEGRNGHNAPTFSRDDRPRRGDGMMAAYNRVFSVRGTGALALPKGSYHLLVTRGLEWSAYETDFEVTAEGTELSASLRHVIDTPGWLSADLHVHSNASFDSKVPLEARAMQFVAEGVEYLVATDHNVVVDYGPVIAKLGLEPWLAATSGDEVTTSYDGHYGVFPLPVDPRGPEHGAIGTRGRTPDQIFRAVRKKFPETIIDVHHPRFDRGLGYFEMMGFDAQQNKATKPGFSLEFDALEILNGYQDEDRVHFERAFTDWLALLDHGVRKTATGNSDTHHLRFSLGGYPRNYLRVPDDRPSAVAVKDVTASIRARSAFFTTGPWVSATVSGHTFGEELETESPSVRVEVEIRAAPWIAVDRLKVYGGASKAKAIEIAPSKETTRFSRVIEVPLRLGDNSLVFRVEGDLPLAGMGVSGEPYGIKPLAVTNPIFIRRNGPPRARP